MADVVGVEVSVGLTDTLVGGSDKEVDATVVDADVAADGVGDLNDSGDEVSGGGRGMPLKSPLTLRLRGGSKRAALSFLDFLDVDSIGTPCAAAAAACLAFSSCSSND